MAYRLDAGGNSERFSGPAASLGATVRPGRPAELRLTALVGRLSTRTAGALDRDLAQAMAEVSVPLGTWFVARAAIAVRGFRTSAARQRWTIVQANGEARLPFLGRRVHGVLQASYLPVVSVAGLGRPTSAFAAGVGLEYRLRPGELRVLYSLERYEFSPAGVGRRPEQMSSLTVALRPRVLR